VVGIVNEVSTAATAVAVLVSEMPLLIAVLTVDASIMSEFVKGSLAMAKPTTRDPADSWIFVTRAAAMPSSVAMSIWNPVVKACVAAGFASKAVASIGIETWAAIDVATAAPVLTHMATTPYISSSLDRQQSPAHPSSSQVPSDSQL
jgi:hypothetical protein